MYVEVPEIKRCCCCIPARYGLLIWIYIRLILSILTLIPIIWISIFFYALFGPGFLTAISVLVVLALLFDVAMNIVALVGGHLKRLKLLKIYYTYNIISLILSTIIFIVLSALHLFAGSSAGFMNIIDLWAYLRWCVAVGIAHYSVQIYLLLLIRTIIHKIGSNCKFRFVNHAAEGEAHCAMDIEKTFTWNNLYEDNEEKNEEFDNNCVLRINEVVEETEDRAEIINVTKDNDDHYEDNVPVQINELLNLIDKSEIDTHNECKETPKQEILDEKKKKSDES